MGNHAFSTYLETTHGEIYIYIMYIYYTPMVEGQNKQNQHVETLKFRQASSGFRLNRPLIVTCWKVMAYIYIYR